MSSTLTTDENEMNRHITPGAKLAEAREIKGFSKDYVAGKLHLRVRVIELLEADDYHNMPEPVFIKGYLRAYAKLLDMDEVSILEDFKTLYKHEKKVEKAPLWQSRRESNKAENAVKWLTLLFALTATIAVALWWHKNKDNERFFSARAQQNYETNNKNESEIRLTDLSKMRSLLSSQSQFNNLEHTGE